MDNYPRVSEAKTVAIDTETYDPNLLTQGAGWATGKGKLLGVSIAVDGWKKYFPLNHNVGNNIDTYRFKDWFKKEICQTKSEKVFHNAGYDVGWIKKGLGLDIQGPLIDTQLAEALLNEHKGHRGYSLSTVAEEYLGEQKKSYVLEDYCQLNGITFKRDVREVIYQIDAQVVGEYAEADADQTLNVWRCQKDLIQTQDLNNIAQLEFGLINLMVQMRLKGVRVDVDRAEQVSREIKLKEQELQNQINRLAGMHVNIYRNADLVKAYDKAGYPFGKTGKGNPSFRAEVMVTLKDPLSPLIQKLKSYSKIRKDFIDGVVIKHNIRGRIHSEINQLKSDEYGTISGRLSMSKPSLHQIPVRDPELGPLMRSLFIAEDGCQWGSFDYSQQEPRLGIHYAVLTGCKKAEEAAEYFQNPDADYHDMICELIRLDYNSMPKAARKEFRSKNKEVTLGKSYGMGRDKLQAKLNMTREEADKFMYDYNECVPYVKELSDKCMNKVTLSAMGSDHVGFIRTLLGRKCRFPFWEPRGSRKDDVTPLKWDAYMEAMNDPSEVLFYNKSPKLAYAYTAYNKLMQGSSADQTKQAMKYCEEAGLIPCLQVHDELNDGSIQSEKQAKEYHDIMYEAVKLKIPSKVSVGLGPSWAEAK